MDTSYRIPSIGTCRTDRRHVGQINDEITDLSPEDVGSTETQGTAWLVLQKISCLEHTHRSVTIKVIPDHHRVSNELSSLKLP
jgi:hypothetical protein